MKKGSLKIFIIITFSVAVVLFLYVATINEIKNMNKTKINRIELLSEKNNRIQQKIVDIQKLTSEDRIVTMAIESLGLIRPKQNLEVLLVSRKQIDQIEKLVNEKYD